MNIKCDVRTYDSILLYEIEKKERKRTNEWKKELVEMVEGKARVRLTISSVTTNTLKIESNPVHEFECECLFWCAHREIWKKIFCKMKICRMFSQIFRKIILIYSTLYD